MPTRRAAPPCIAPSSRPVRASRSSPVVEHGGQVARDEGGALERVLVALVVATGHVERLGAVRQRVERRARGDLGGHPQRQLRLVDDALDAGVEAGVLGARLLVAHAEEGRPLRAGVGGGDGDHRQAGLHRDGLGRVHDAAAAQRDEAVGVLGQLGRLAHAGDLGVRARAVKAARHRQLGVLPELLGDQQRRAHGELREHLLERLQTPADDHAGHDPTCQGPLHERLISWPRMAENGRILTTHVGSLPRPQDVVDVVFAEDKGEEVDPAGVRARHRRRGQGPRPAPGRRGRRHRQRRRDEQDRLRDLHPPSPERLRGRRRAARDAGRPRRLPELPRPPRRRGRDREVPAPDLPRPDHLREPRAARARPRAPAQRDRGPARRRRVHERPVAGDRRPLPAQRVLRHAPTSTSTPSPRR